jgi:8-oxo-dGTP pyrophosphatase MutT (NUDIX family)
MSAGSERVEAPRWLAEHAAKFAASGAVPVAPRLAATVVLLREHSSGFEIFTQRRAATMAFAAGMYAFPGGSVDPADSVDPAATAAGAPEDGSAPGMATRMGLPAESADAVVRAAVRELAEETGVRVRPADLRPWARWLTPEFEPRRFDTFFFVAAMPADQQPADAAGESDHALWAPPAQALRLPMLPPTRRTLTELAELSDVPAVLAAADQRDVSTPIRPVIEVDADGAWLRLR